MIIRMLHLRAGALYLLWGGLLLSGTADARGNLCCLLEAAGAAEEHQAQPVAPPDTAVDIEPENLPPVIGALPAFTTAEASLLSFRILAADPNHDALQWHFIDLPVGARFDEQTGLFRWIPSYEQAGDYTIAFRVCDTKQHCAEAALRIQITNTNRPPQLEPLLDYTVRPGEHLILPIRATDPDGDGLTLKVGPLPAYAAFNSAAQTLSWKPQVSQFGTYRLFASVTDGTDRDDREFSIEVIPEGLTIRGSVKSLSGEPQEGVLVELYHRRTRVQDTETDTLGGYVFSGLANGRYRVTIPDARYQPQHHRVHLNDFHQEGLDFTYSKPPRAGTRPMADVVGVPDNKVDLAEVDLPLQDADPQQQTPPPQAKTDLYISGTLATLAGDPISGVPIELAFGERTHHAISGVGGEFTFQHLSSGLYTLVIPEHPSYLFMINRRSVYLGESPRVGLEFKATQRTTD